MDQIFDRLGRLFRSWTVGDDPENDPNIDWTDPDMQEAWAELNDDLDAAEKARARRKAQQEEQSRRYGTSSKTLEIAKAYNTLGVSENATWEEVKKAHKKLLIKNHPDRHAGNEKEMKMATVKTQMINEAFEKIKDYVGK
jgi:DnaJ-class molecular chaperone